MRGGSIAEAWLGIHRAEAMRPLRRVELGIRSRGVTAHFVLSTASEGQKSTRVWSAGAAVGRRLSPDGCSDAAALW